jgi:hypothetical protein
MKLPYEAKCSTSLFFPLCVQCINHVTYCLATASKYGLQRESCALLAHIFFCRTIGMRPSARVCYRTAGMISMPFISPQCPLWPPVRSPGQDSQQRCWLVHLRSQWEQPSCHHHHHHHHHHDAGSERTHPALEIRHVLGQEDQIHLDLVPWAHLDRHERLLELLVVLPEVVLEQEQEQEMQ